MASEQEEQEFSYELKIPKERVAVLIGKNGQVKKDLEKETNSKINVDSKEGDVTISGTDSIGLFSAKEVINAIGRGFNPDIARLLLKQDYMFELISLDEYAKTKNDLMRLRGRVIGAEGKSREVVEELTETYICVYGKTAGIIGAPDNVFAAKQGIEALLKGSTHAAVFGMLERKRRELKRLAREMKEKL